MVYQATNKRAVKARGQSGVATTPSQAPQQSTSDVVMSYFKLNKLIRPALGAGLSIAYGHYFDNRILFSTLEKERALLMAASIFVSDVVGNTIFPQLQITKDMTGGREFENMLVEPLISGALYTGAKYLLVDGNTDEALFDYIKGVAIDVAAGVGEGAIMKVW